MMRVIIGEEKRTIQDQWERSEPSTTNQYSVELVHQQGFLWLSRNGLIFKSYHLVPSTSSISQPSIARFHINPLSEKTPQQ